MNNIKISIIMPVYNSGIYINNAVESILNQSLKEIELILVDDGSTDGTSDKCDDWAQKDTRVIVVHKKNNGICSARNTALKIARGEYIGWSDHDDEYIQGYLEDAYNTAKKYDADLVKVGKKNFILDNNHCIRTKLCCLPSKVYLHNDIKKNFFKLIDSNEFECLWDGIYRKSLLDKYKIELDESYLCGGEDIDFNIRIFPLVNKIVTIEKIYYLHYIRKGFSTSSKPNPNNIIAKKNIVNQLLKTINILNININQHQQEYTYLLLRQYIASICRYYSSKNYLLNKKERMEKIKEIKSEPFYYEFCNKQNTFSYIRISKKYGLLYFLFKHNLYNYIFKLYQNRKG